MTTSNRNSTLSGRQAKAMAVLLGGGSFTEAAQAGGVNERTLRRWRQSPEFRDALAEGERGVITATARRAYSLGSEALATLRNIMVDTSESGSTRVAAARGVLDALLRLHEVYSVNERLTALERQLENKE